MASKALTVLIIALAFCVPALSQEEDAAKRVYNASQDSVFLVYLNDSKGDPKALGSAFLVGPRTLVTNAHVIRGGAPVIAVGPVRIAAKVVATDNENDLAILTVEADLTSAELALSSGTPSPGERIFAIGNPEGLEKTLSEGLISGIRHVDKKTLIQISSPISHGSSGGPVLDSAGQVVGVAVGMLTDGQNLNFAVPVEYVRALLKRGLGPTKSTTTISFFDIQAEAETLRTAKYSSEADSPYQRALLMLSQMSTTFLDRNPNSKDLEALTCLGTDQWTLLDQALMASRALYKVQPNSENGALLAYALLRKAQSDDLQADFSEAGSTQKADALRSRDAELKEIVSLTAYSGRNQNHPLFLSQFALAGADKMLKNYVASLALNEAALHHSSKVCGSDVKQSIYRDLISESQELGHSAQAQSWFQRLSAEYQPEDTDWDAEADRRDAAKDYLGAAEANEKAAEANEYYSIDYCWAASEAFMSGKQGAEHVIEDGRKCIDASVKTTSDTRQKQFNERLPIVYRALATVLEDRGVHKAALDYIKESLAATPEDPQSLYEEATIFESLERYTECVSAAQAAISASDGKFSWMHFGLGNCFFDKEEWSSAAASFRIAADADKHDSSSAFNLALCYLRQGFGSDAKVWFNEALRRDPDAETRAKIQSAMRGLQ